MVEKQLSLKGDNHVVSYLDDTDRTVLKLLERRKQALQALDSVIE
jgi:hypothetical protein